MLDQLERSSCAHVNVGQAPRGELEITDVNNAYIKAGMLTWDLLEGWWTDAGTIESLYLANQLVGQSGANNHTVAA